MVAEIKVDIREYLRLLFRSNLNRFEEVFTYGKYTAGADNRYTHY